jgi:hypothetical protein
MSVGFEGQTISTSGSEASLGGMKNKVLVELDPGMRVPTGRMQHDINRQAVFRFVARNAHRCWLFIALAPIEQG